VIRAGVEVQIEQKLLVTATRPITSPGPPVPLRADFGSQSARTDAKSGIDMVDWVNGPSSERLPVWSRDAGRGTRPPWHAWERSRANAIPHNCKSS
jgi:hypothetical protein